MIQARARDVGAMLRTTGNLAREDAGAMLRTTGDFLRENALLVLAAIAVMSAIDIAGDNIPAFEKVTAFPILIATLVF